MDWKNYERLQALADSARSIGRGLTCEGAASRELEALVAGRPRRGTATTALANEDRKLRRRAAFVRRNLVLLTPATLPSSSWALVERKLAPLTGAERAQLLATAAGETYEEQSVRTGIPVGTLKSRMSRLRIKIR